MTARDEAVNFSAIQSFFVRPEIRVLDEDTVETGEAELIPAELATPLLAATEVNLVARGYAPAPSPRAADIAVELVYLRTSLSDYYCYNWSDWAYWGYPGYYSYYPPYSCSGTLWRSGMLVTNVVDLMSMPPAAEADAPVTPPDATDTSPTTLRGFWYSGVYGVELESEAAIVDRAVEGIDQSFEQSPYFSRTP